ncbi:MAG: hypothetical protein ACP5HJ_01515 [Candidatus Micrarchaeia archaeon]|jgi:hypothetical protein
MVTYKLKVLRKFNYVKAFVVKQRIGSTKLENFLLKIAKILFKEKK